MMVASMTGYGRAKLRADAYRITVEMKSVNHRFFETNIRMPRRMMVYEDKIKKIMNEAMKRGRVEVNVTIEGDVLQETKLLVHKDLIEQYLHASEQLKSDFSLQDELKLNDILLIPNLIEQIEVEKENPELLIELLKVVEEASANLQQMRQQEGERLSQDIMNQLGKMEESVSALKSQAPKVVEKYKERLRSKLAEIKEIDEQRFVTEIAIMTDRCDIHEEIIRLGSHIQQFYETLKSSEPIGRKMEFLLQEMYREVNTIGSKGNDIHISNCVVEMKNSLEKMREQVQNIE